MAPTLPFDIFELLRDDHQRVTGVMDSIQQSGGAERENYILQLNDELTEHLTVEEDFFYSRIEDFEELVEAIRQSYGEHEQIRSLLDDVLNLETGSAEWEAAFAGLRETKEDHVMMEEQEVFPLVARILPAEELTMLGEQVNRQKRVVVYRETPKRPPSGGPRAGL